MTDHCARWFDVPKGMRDSNGQVGGETAPNK